MVDMGMGMGMSNYYFRIILITIVLSIFSVNLKAQTTVAENLKGLFLFSPSITASETWTDNISLNSNVRESGWISTISPGLNVRSTSGIIKGSLNYSLNYLNYSNGGNNNSLQNSLNSLFNVEVIDGHGYADFSGVISQQTISAFSLQTNNLNGNLNSNKTEVSSYSFSPYYKGRLASFFNYEARYRLATTKAKSSNNFSSNDSTTSLNLTSDNFFGKVNWGLDINHQIISHKINPETKLTSLNTSLNYPVFDKLSLTLSAGRQSQNYSSTTNDNSWTSGAGFSWSISEMTKFAANVEKNPLGRMHSLDFEHRTPRTNWRVSDVKSVSLNNSRNFPQNGNNYDLLFNQFSSIEPDVNKRSQLVNNYMLLNGITSNSTPVNGYLTSGTSIQRTQNISFALLGIRDTVTFTATRSTGDRVGLSTLALDDFSSFNSINQEGVSIMFSHRLTENTVISNQLSKQKTLGDVNSQNSEIKSLNITASTRISSKANLSLSARRSIFSSTSFPYKETAITSSLAVQF
jgi:uncharacterized protein (PEP-CTERM system associated)